MKRGKGCYWPTWLSSQQQALTFTGDHTANFLFVGYVAAYVRRIRCWGGQYQSYGRVRGG